MTKDEIETALRNGTLQGQARNGKWYNLRRNGATKTWKRDPNRWSIPVKAGLRDCFRIDQDTTQQYLRVGEGRD
jgi:hypothetical protein